MKKAIKIFLIISFITAGINISEAMTYSDLGRTDLAAFYFINAASMIIVSYLGDRALELATCKRDLRGIAIVTLFFGSLIAGILMLCISDREFVPNATQNNQQNQYNPYTNPYGNPYSSPYGSPYGAPYGANNNPYGAPDEEDDEEDENSDTSDEDKNQNSTYGSPYGNPYGTPYHTAQNDTEQDETENEPDNKQD